MLHGIPSCLLLVYWCLGIKSKIVYKLYHETGFQSFSLMLMSEGEFYAIPCGFKIQEFNF